MPRNAEDHIQASIVAFLRAVLVNARVFAVPNGNFRTKPEAAKLKWTGVLAGVPDLAIVSRGGSISFIEVKTEKGVLSPAQKEFIEWCGVNGIQYCVARSIDDVRLALDQWRIQTREIT